jgi:hypothetical protein
MKTALTRVCGGIVSLSRKLSLMQPNVGPLLLFCILVIDPASSNTATPVSSKHGELPGIMQPILLLPQQQGGYYRPNNVPPARQGVPCGHEDSGVCPVDVPILPGATGAQLYQLGKQQDQRHLAEAVAYLTASANLGYGPAEGALGTAYVMGGQGVRHDAVKGVHLLELAAAQGERGAAVYLGMEYEDGDNGVPRDQAKAIVYLKQAAQQHHSIAEHRLGLDYEIGNGVAHDRALAIEYLRRASTDNSSNTIAAKTAKMLATTRHAQFHSVEEIDSIVNPPPPPPSPGACPSFQTYLAGPRAQAQTYLFCQAHPGCPYGSGGLRCAR